MSRKILFRRKNKHSLALEFKLGICWLASILLTSCTSTPLKAPCDTHGHFCGSKVKINQW